VQYYDAVSSIGVGPSWAINGFDQTTDYIVNQYPKLNVTLNKAVSSISYSSGCTVTTADGSTYSAGLFFLQFFDVAPFWRPIHLAFVLDRFLYQHYPVRRLEISVSKLFHPVASVVLFDFVRQISQ
jgi:hypothetical protein